MLDSPTLALFSLACLALTITPGPDMLLIASRSASQGRRAGFATLAGIQAGTYCHALAAAFGLSQLFVLQPLAYDVVRFAGAAYLLYLAWQCLRADSTAAASVAPQPLSVLAVFRQGLLTNLLNPKMALFVLALFPQFVQPQAGSIPLQMLILATVLNGIGLLVNGVVIFSASALRARLQRGDGAVWGDRLLAAVFTLLAGKLLLDGKG